MTFTMLSCNSMKQCFPPAATFTDANLPDLTSKVCIVTGANTGVGKELSELLYSKNATVYMACRTESKAVAAIEDVKSRVTGSAGRLEYLHLDLGDLTTIKKSSEDFLAKEQRLHVLFNNAGVMFPDEAARTKQGYELQLGTNNVGTWLFTKYLTPTLQATAKKEPADTVRVVWVSSIAAEWYSINNGVPVDDLLRTGGKDYTGIKGVDTTAKYGISKAGNYFHSVEFARRYGHGKDGIVSVAAHPGNLKTDLYRNVSGQGGFLKMQLKGFTNMMLYPAINGAYTEMYAGFSPDVTANKMTPQSGLWIVPFGRIFNIRKDLGRSAKLRSEGGNGNAEKFWNWTEAQVKEYL